MTFRTLPFAVRWHLTVYTANGRKKCENDDSYLVSFFSLCALQSFLAFWTLKKYQTWTAASADETKIQHQNYMT